jgi:hypothetical protein
VDLQLPICCAGQQHLTIQQRLSQLYRVVPPSILLLHGSTAVTMPWLLLLLFLL